MTPIRIALVVFAATILELSGCGGAGGGGSLASVGNNGGIGGTGITSSGTIDGFGSIFVNGIEFETDASEVSLDGLSGSADSLRLGMVVTVRGTVNEDGKTGVADSVSYKDDIQGPISAISISQDNDALLITVLGVQIIAERKATVFDGVSFDTLAVNDVIEVSGFVESELQLRATRIEKKSAVDPGTSDVTLKGVVTGLTGTQFSLGSNLVDFSNADLSGINGGTLSEGLHVEVYGRLANNLILADRIEQDDDFTDDLTDQEELSVQGVITSYQDVANFIVNGVVVDASNAALEPTDLILANGLVVEVEGVWDGLKLVAQEVGSRRGSIELDARVAAIDVDAKTISLQYFSGTVTVQMTSTTLLKDDTGRANPFALRDITSGDFLEVEAIMVGNDLVASRIQRDKPDDDVIQAPVERFNAGTSITLLGITFSTTGAEFEDARDREINTGQFFSTLQIGDLVKVTDEGLADGIADEVEFETEEGVDDEDFEDVSDDQCDDPNADSDDDCDSDDEDCDAHNAIANDDCDSEDEDDDDSEDDDSEDEDEDEEEDEEDDSEDDEDEEDEEDD